jgi:hypothetical protein
MPESVTSFVPVESSAGLSLNVLGDETQPYQGPPVGE